jgi:ATP-dependent DNA helicase RecQ
VTAVLHGQPTEAVRTRGHDGLSTFGLLKDASAAEIRGYIDQLTQAGLLARQGEPYPVLLLTERGRYLLRGDGAIVLYRQPRQLRGKAAKRARTAPVDAGVDERLFEALRLERLALSRERHVPPYVIFHDATLRHLARTKPTSRESLLAIPGIGESKMQRFGDRMLAVIRAHQ